MSTTITKRVKRTKVLSTKVTERDNRYMQAMVKRYYDEGHIHQAKTSTLLRLIVKAFLHDAQAMNKKLLAVINKKLISYIQTRTEIINFLSLINFGRRIILQCHQQQDLLTLLLRIISLNSVNCVYIKKTPL
jgi:hypothetical protein